MTRYDLHLPANDDGLGRLSDHGGLGTLSDDGGLGAYITDPDAAASESPRPYLHPLATLAGRTVSAYRPEDHAWHWGLSLAVSNIDVPGEALPVNLWGGVTYVDGEGYVQLANNGSQTVEDVRTAPGSIRHGVSWRTSRAVPFLSEARSLEWSVHGSAGGEPWWRLDVTSRWTNTGTAPLAFGSPTTAGRENAGYGGLFLRGAADLLGSEVLLEGTGPVGQTDAMGASARWCALRNRKAGITVVMTADTANPVASSPWFVRTDPVVMLCAAPFFHRKYLLAAGGTSEWKWSLLLADEAWDSARIEAAVGPESR